MAKSARQTVFEGMELVPAALAPFVEQRLKAELKGYWQVQVAEKIGMRTNSEGNLDWDQQHLFKCMNIYWSEAFAKVLGPSERSYISELREVRNKLAHNEKFSCDDAERALDSVCSLLEAAGAGATAGEISIMRDAILRTKFASLQSRKLPSSDLAPWREVIEPHQDVAKGGTAVPRLGSRGVSRRCARIPVWWNSLSGIVLSHVPSFLGTKALAQGRTRLLPLWVHCSLGTAIGFPLAKSPFAIRPSSVPKAPA